MYSIQKICSKNIRESYIYKLCIILNLYLVLRIYYNQNSLKVKHNCQKQFSKKSYCLHKKLQYIYNFILIKFHKNLKIYIKIK